MSHHQLDPHDTDYRWIKTFGGMDAELFLKVYKINVPPGWRIGQAAFSALLQVRPDLAERIRGTDIDPFYEARSLDKFETWITENWNQKES